MLTCKYVVQLHRMETQREYQIHVNVSCEGAKTGTAFPLPAHNQFQLSTLTNVSS